MDEKKKKGGISMKDTFYIIALSFVFPCSSQCNKICIPLRRQTVETAATPFRRFFLMVMTDRPGRSSLLIYPSFAL
ncbi:hypothetical protein GHT06_007707 [Daphnia sinensis]|uniref:Uncharacterized protein n=1 Tax=Daphnia sinensis TaxID=1820382 RepID=A0AAD5Q1C8_9CRUS|nr:hypothetical protein GHT06_007707 [Daphnia sinensis]